MLKYFKNIYVFIFAVFLYLDAFYRYKFIFNASANLNKDIDKLEDEKEYYKKEIH